jgi:hypothetical protein
MAGTIRPKKIPQEMVVDVVLWYCGTLFPFFVWIGGWSRRCSAKRIFAHHMASSGQ